MNTAPTERLDAIRVELGTILEAKVSELMITMRQSEELTRRILASELEASRAKNLREDLETQTEAVQDLGLDRYRTDGRRLARQR